MDRLVFSSECSEDGYMKPFIPSSKCTVGQIDADYRCLVIGQPGEDKQSAAAAGSNLKNCPGALLGNNGSERTEFVPHLKRLDHLAGKSEISYFLRARELFKGPRPRDQPSGCEGL